jgi:hypothetical protein
MDRIAPFNASAGRYDACDVSPSQDLVICSHLINTSQQARVAMTTVESNRWKISRFNARGHIWQFQRSVVPMGVASIRYIAGTCLLWELQGSSSIINASSNRSLSWACKSLQLGSGGGISRQNFRLSVGGLTNSRGMQTEMEFASYPA